MKCIRFLVFFIFLSAPAYAACTSPAADDGAIQYFSAASPAGFRYCDGTNWQDFVPSGIARTLANGDKVKLWLYYDADLDGSCPYGNEVANIAVNTGTDVYLCAGEEL